MFIKKIISAGISFFISLLAIFVISCGDDSNGDSSDTPPAPKKLCTISWTANRESAVNRSGGGYKVYYSQSNGFNVTDAGGIVIDVPYVSGSLSPTTTSVELTTGTWYFRIQAYSTLNSGSVSAVSGQQSIVIP